MARMRKNFRSFKGNVDAAVSVEFAVIFPFILFLFMNVVVLFDGFRADRAVTSSSLATADLLSRFQEDLDNTQVANVIETAKALLANYATRTTPTIVIASFRNKFDEFDKSELVCAKSNLPSAAIGASDFESIALPYIPEGDSLIMVLVETKYMPILVNKLFGEFTLTEVQFRRPRFVAELNLGC